MDAIELERSERAFRQETRWIVACAVAVAILAAILMRVLVHMAVDAYLLSGLLTFLAVMLMAWVAILIRNKKWHDTRYVLGKDAITITRPDGLLGVTQDIYLYESILSVNFRQDYFGKRYGYGDITITIPKLNEALILKNVVEPSRQLPLLKNHLKHKSDQPRALVT